MFLTDVSSADSRRPKETFGEKAARKARVMKEFLKPNTPPKPKPQLPDSDSTEDDMYDANLVKTAKWINTMPVSDLMTGKLRLAERSYVVSFFYILYSIDMLYLD